jgi:hypothetical protein
MTRKTSGIYADRSMRLPPAGSHAAYVVVLWVAVTEAFSREQQKNKSLISAVGVERWKREEQSA